MEPKTLASFALKAQTWHPGLPVRLISEDLRLQSEQLKERGAQRIHFIGNSGGRGVQVSGRAVLAGAALMRRRDGESFH